MQKVVDVKRDQLYILYYNSNYDPYRILYMYNRLFMYNRINLYSLITDNCFWKSHLSKIDIQIEIYEKIWSKYKRMINLSDYLKLSDKYTEFYNNRIEVSSFWKNIKLEEFLKLPPVIGVLIDEKFIILDGIHRSLLYLKDINYKPKFITLFD